MNQSDDVAGEQMQRQVSGDVALVVVTHNSSRALPPLLETLSRSDSALFSQIVFIDNASSDSTRESITGRLSRAEIHVNATNVGFAAAVNQGVNATAAKYILLANPDVAFTTADVEVLVVFLDHHPEAAAVSPRLIFPDGRPQWSVRRFPTHSNIWFSRQSPLRFLEGLIPGKDRYTVPDPAISTKVEAVAATFLLMRRDAFLAVGGMDERYFLYVEDTDLCKRWHDRGFEVWLEPDVTIVHDWQGGSGRDHALGSYHRDGIRRYFQVHHSDKPIRNQLLFGLLKLAG